MGLKIKLLAFILPFICPFFYILRLNLCNSFLRTVQARIFKCGTYICRMSDCIMGLRLRVMAFIFLFLFIFFDSLYYMLTLKFFIKKFSQELLKREC